MQVSDGIYYKYINFNIVNKELKYNSSMGGKEGTHKGTLAYTISNHFKLFKNIYLKALPKAKNSKIFFEKVNF